MQSLVVRNAAESIACAWIPNACYSLGNIFSGKRYTEQSRNELIIANSVWAAVTYSGVVFISFLPSMRSFRFVVTPDRRPTVFFCIARLGKATITLFVLVTVVIFAFSWLDVYLIDVEPGTLKFKFDCYAVNLLLAGYFTGITRAVKKIYYQDTVQGRDKLLQKRQQKMKMSKITPVSATTLEVPNVRHHPIGAAIHYQPPSFWVAYMRNMPLASVPLFASMFVHILSQQCIVDRGNSALTAFIFAGIALKLGGQELAKHYVFRKRVRSARVMCVLVGVPTVLIDTQMRIVVLGTNSTNTAAMGALGMAMVEICLRAGKAALVIWKIRHRKALLARDSQKKSIVKAFGQRFSKSVVPEPTSRSSPSPSSNDFEVWRRQLHAFHTAELNADMYAEYISIGCSASILFFYGNHPHFSLLRQSESIAPSGIDTTVWRVSQLGMLVLQVGVEIVVDYISIVLEIFIGIEFDHVKNLGSFLAAMFIITSVMNINISVCIYLS